MGEGLVSTAPSISIESNVGDFVVALDDWKLYIGKVHDLDEDETYIHFLSHNDIVHSQSKFKVPRIRCNVWVSLNNILCITLELYYKRSKFVQTLMIMYLRSLMTGLNVSKFNKLKKIIVTFLNLFYFSQNSL